MMESATLDQELHQQFELLALNEKQEVINFVRSLASQASADTQEKRVGVLGSELLKFAGMLSDEDAAEMLQAIEEGCEQVDPDDWK